MSSHFLLRVPVYLIICLLSYVVLDWASPQVDYSPKGILLMVDNSELQPAISPNIVRLLPFAPAYSSEIAWINIEKVADHAAARTTVERRAKELAASVGANAIIVLAEGQAKQFVPSSYPLYVFRGKAVVIPE